VDFFLAKFLVNFISFVVEISVSVSMFCTHNSFFLSAPSSLASLIEKRGERESEREREREREKKSIEVAVTRLLVVAVVAAEASREREFAPVFATFSSSCQTTTTI
jgi:hypothetical protein